MFEFVTQRQVAAKLGMPRSTVGAALNPRLAGTLRPEVRERIQNAARRLNYRPHRYAQIMRRGRSGTVGLLHFGALGSLQGYLAQAMRKVGYHLLATDVLIYNLELHAAWENLLDARIEGLVLANPAEWLQTSILRKIRQLNLPVVSVEGVRFPAIPQVRPDIVQGISDLTRHLLRLGHRRLVLLACWSSQTRDATHCWPVLERIRGFQAAVRQHRLSHGAADRVTAEVVCEDLGDYWSRPFEAGKSAMRKLLERAKRPDAVLCSNDHWALGGLTACAEAGVRVPYELAVTGFDDDDYGEYGSVPLTTVALPIEAMANEAASRLSALIMKTGPVGRDPLTRLPCELIVRQSCGAGRVDRTHRPGRPSKTSREKQNP